ncbi:copper resistance protein NlpE N-terminal domain-containing protein [Psychrobacter sp. CAL346-MNA-CIBAN-0220]|uniref:copper resistance protein NlpE N-terminal domain-containing protein n=1 Tax=Psychrobacter sp. CAL346-MNA-CIBAN-0220 TaxID=3140457 RepID=UPI003327EA2E
MSILPSIITVTNHFRRVLLALPVVMLMGCNNQSSPAASVDTMQVAPASAMQNTDQQDLDKSLDASNKDHLGDLKEGQSEDGTRIQHTPMISEMSGDSTLQATLMGDYGGNLACSFCAGIGITLNLFADGSVLKTSVYNNPKTPHVPLIESGIYRQDNNTITIVYDKKKIEIFRIQDNHLVMLDENKKLNDDYVLSRK